MRRRTCWRGNDGLFLENHVDAHALLIDIVRKPLPPLDGATPLAAVAGLDSLGMVSLVVKLEGALGRELTEQELERLITVDDVDRLLGGQ